MADEDKDKLAGAEDSGRDPDRAKGAVSTGEAPASGEGDDGPRSTAGDQRADSLAGRAADAAGNPAVPGEDGAPAVQAPDDADAGETADPLLPPGLAHRPAGFAAGYPQSDPQAYPPGPVSDDSPDRGGEGTGAGAGAGGSIWVPAESAQPGVQASPYAPYGEYDSYQGQGQEQDYGAYGQPAEYGVDSPYGQGYGPPEGYGQGYPAPPEYAEGQGYPAPGQYGDDARYGQGQAYGPGPGYGADQPYQSYGQGYDQGYPQAPYGGPSYGGPSYGGEQPYAEGQPYGQGYGPAQGYAEGQPGQRQETAADGRAAGPGGEDGAGPADAAGGADGSSVAEAQAGGPGLVSGRSEAEAPDRGQGPGASPYPPQDSYRWQAPYEAAIPLAPGQVRPSQYPARDPRGEQPPGRGRTDEAPRQYGREPTYPPPRPAQGPAAQPAAQPPEALAPLPGHAGDQQQTAETAEDLTIEALLPGKRPVPGAGWRRLLFKGSGGRIKPRESPESVRRRELIGRVRTPVAGGHHRVAVMSLKGGVGKTTTTVSLGSMLASLRGDRIIALDANPDRGTLSDKVRLETAATVRDLLNERDQIQRYADVRAFTSQAPSRLEVLASDRDPAVSVAFSEEDYYDAARVLEHYYSISLTDCGTGLLHSAMSGVLRMADQIVLVSSPSVDGARSASATLDWLDAHEYGDLVRNAVVVLSMVRQRSKSSIDLDRLEQHFASRCRAVARIPYDVHLEEGAEVDLEQMSPATVNAYLVLAATVGDGFAWPRRAARQPVLGRGRPRRAAGNGYVKRYH